MSVSATSGATPGHRRGRRKPSSGWFRAGIASVVVAGVGAAALILVGGHSLPVTLLALALTASVALGGAAWAEEHHRRRRLQHLYESRLLLQGTSGSPLSVKETLARLCQVLDARFAEVVVLPDAIDSTALVVRVRDGEIVETAQALDEGLLDDVFSVIVPATLQPAAPRRGGRAPGCHHPQAPWDQGRGHGRAGGRGPGARYCRGR